MFPWSDPPAAPRFSVGSKIYSGEHRGTVVSVGTTTIEIQWDDGDYGPITYPVDAEYLKEAMPWEN